MCIQSLPRGRVAFSFANSLGTLPQPVRYSPSVRLWHADSRGVPTREAKAGRRSKKENTSWQNT